MKETLHLQDLDRQFKIQNDSGEMQNQCVKDYLYSHGGHWRSIRMVLLQHQSLLSQNSVNKTFRFK